MLRTSRNASRRTTMPYSLAEAAEATGLNRSTILRAIKNGRISGQRDEQGAWSVEPVELHRVFPPAAAIPKATPQDAQADALVAELRAQLAEMRSQRDAWQSIAERLALAAPKPEPEPMSWWRWLRTTGCLAGAGLLLALSTVPAGAQQQQQQQPQPQRECFTVVGATNPSAALNVGAILLDRCTGKTWSLGRGVSRPGGGYTIRWLPITVDANEPTYGP
jgi:hypothetical protein